MSRAEKFIKDYTRNCSNIIETINKDKNVAVVYQPWLTPEDALRAVEIAREEVVERACDAYCKVCGHYAHTTPTCILRHACNYYKDFKQAIKDEQGRR